MFSPSDLMAKLHFQRVHHILLSGRKAAIVPPCHTRRQWGPKGSSQLGVHYVKEKSPPQTAQGQSHNCFSFPSKAPQWRHLPDPSACQGYKPFSSFQPACTERQMTTLPTYTAGSSVFETVLLFPSEQGDPIYAFILLR